MTARATRLAVFDCDGTLVDGQADICRAMDSAFAALGLIAPDHHLVRRAVGLSLPRTMRHLAPDLDERTRGELTELYKQAFRTARAEGTLAEPLFPGMAQLLYDMRQAGWLLGVATGKSDMGLQHCLATHGLTDHFTTLQTADRHPSKPHPAMLEAALDEAGAQPEDAVMIGDTAFDIIMAVDTGVRAIGVGWGYHDEYELREAGACGVAATPAAIMELLG